MGFKWRRPVRSVYLNYRWCRWWPHRMTLKQSPGIWHWLWWMWAFDDRVR